MFCDTGGMDDRPQPPPWGLLIIEALKKSKLSARKAAALAGLSEGRWRQIASGYQNVSSGVYAPVRGPADTVARMAHVVGVTPEQLERAERPDAAEELRLLEAGTPEPEDRDDLEEQLMQDPEARAAIRVLIERSRALHGAPPLDEKSGDEEPRRGPRSEDDKATG